jgi:adenylate cyclase
VVAVQFTPEQAFDQTPGPRQEPPFPAATAMNPQTLDAIRPCLEGAIPAIMATCAADGTPNVAYISQVYYVDGGMWRCRSSSSTRRAEHPGQPGGHGAGAAPGHGAFYRLHMRYLRTETTGALFDR